MSASNNPDPDDPFEWILDNYFDTNSKATKEAVEDILYDGDVALNPWLEDRGITAYEVTTEDVKAYFKDLKRAYEPSVQQEYATRVEFIYGKFLSYNVEGIDINPFERVSDNHDILDENHPEQTPIYDKQTIQDVLFRLHPCYFVITLTMLKTTRRIGGTVNLDLCDCHLDHPAANWELDRHVRDYPDHIYYSPKPTEGEDFRGETRDSSSKTVTHTIIPLDDELKDALIWWIMMRRADQKQGPLFTKPTPREEGLRVTDGEYRWRLEQVTDDLGYRFGGHDPGNIKPHYWRHWSTSIMRDRVKKSIVDYFRGDKGNTGDGYDHYTPEKRQVWIDNIPKFLNNRN